MAKRNHKLHFGVWFLIAIAVSGFIFASSSNSNYLAFSLSPLSFQGNIDLPDILCNVKSTVNGVDSNGEVVLVAQSTAFEKHPRTTFSLVGGQNDTPVETFKVANKMRCDFPNGNFVDMTVASSDLKVVIYAKDSAGIEKEVWNNSVKSTSAVPIVNNHEETLSTVSANTVDIEKYLEQGDYETTMRIVTFGTVKIFYDGYESVKYDVVIPDNKIVSYVTLDVTKDTPAKSGSPSDSQNPQGTQSPEVEDISGTLDALQLCIASFDVSCMTNQVFLPYFIGGIGLIAVVGALTTKNTRVAFDQFGNPMR